MYTSIQWCTHLCFGHTSCSPILLSLPPVCPSKVPILSHYFTYLLSLCDSLGLARASLMSMSVRICSLEYESLNSGSINEECDFLCYKSLPLPFARGDERGGMWMGVVNHSILYISMILQRQKVIKTIF